MKKIVIIVLLIGIILVTSCIENTDTEKRKEYEKCTSVCASVLEEDFVTLELCRQECKKKFLDESQD